MFYFLHSIYLSLKLIVCCPPLCLYKLQASRNHCHLVHCFIDVSDRYSELPQTSDIT